VSATGPPLRCDTRTSGSVLPFEVGALQKELLRLRRAMAPECREGDLAAVSRACLANVVAICTTSEEAERATRTVESLASGCPCRFVRLLLEPAAREACLEAVVTTCSSRTPSGGHLICCEEIDVRAAGDATEVAASTIPPLLVADVPVFAWWPGDPDLSGPVVRQLLELADTAILDSARSAAPAQRMREMAALLDERAHVAAPVDLAWPRVESWREIVADFFDAPGFARHAAALGAVRVAYARSAPDDPVGAWLLAGWVSSRLRLGSIERIEVVPAPGRPGGSIQSVELRADRADPPAAFRAARVEGGDFVRAEVETPVTCPIPRVVRVVDPEERECLLSILETRGCDHLYEEALLEAVMRMAR
jgi:glucose-6-phosphate dehydrogenase assembly protein OpcA